MDPVTLTFALLLVAGIAVWLIRRSTRSPVGHDAIDREELEEAEREVRDLDAGVTPDEADDHLPDWGPGAPRT
jgi:hypothetical protein